MIYWNRYIVSLLRVDLVGYIEFVSNINPFKHNLLSIDTKTHVE